nr:hypothetical protein [Granulicella sp. S190]
MARGTLGLDGKEIFLYENKVTGLEEDLGAMVWCFSDDLEAEALISFDQVGSQVDDFCVSDRATVTATEVPCGLQELPPDTTALFLWMDGQQAMVSVTVFAKLNVDQSD